MAEIGTSTPIGPAWPNRPSKPVETDNRRAPDSQKPDKDGKKKQRQDDKQDNDNNPHIDEYA